MPTRFWQTTLSVVAIGLQIALVATFFSRSTISAHVLHNAIGGAVSPYCVHTPGS